MKVKSKFIIDYISDSATEAMQQVINAKTEMEAIKKFNKRNQGKIIYVHPMLVSANTAKNIWNGDYVFFDQFQL